MLLTAKELLVQRQEELLTMRSSLGTHPRLALVWVGDDPQTAIFVKAKQKMAKELNCDFILHHLEKASHRQLEAVIASLNGKRDIHGIVLQLPLPLDVEVDSLIELLDANKDVDGLKRPSRFLPPTPAGIISLLKANNYDIAKMKTVIIGAGRLVGQPLAELFQKNSWFYYHITKNAETQGEKIKEADLLISCTGVPNLVTPTMVNREMVVIDGSGVDVDVAIIEPLVQAVTPKRGAIGPLTVSYLFENLFTAVQG